MQHRAIETRNYSSVTPLDNGNPLSMFKPGMYFPQYCTLMTYLETSMIEE